MDAPSLSLDRSPEEGARRLALSYLAQAAAALPRLDDSADVEGLHDFRVALRRLRSALRAYREALGGGPGKKLARRLQRLAAATNPGRDAEVQLAWVEEQRAGLARGHRPGCDWLIDRLVTRRDEAYAEITGHVAGDFGKLAGRLRERLSVYEVEIAAAGAPAPTFAAESARLLGEMADELARHLSRIEGAADADQAHAARIAGKRLRYLLDPLAGEAPRAGPLIKELKGLQDLLGELHDAHVLEETLATALEEAAALRARRILHLTLDGADERQLRTARRRALEPGLLALARANRARRDQLFAEIGGRFLEGEADAFFAAVGALAGELGR